MKISRHRKNQRERFALQPTCPNCGQEGRHEMPRNLDDVIAGRRWFSCEPRHVRIPVTVETDSGQQVEGHITGDPGMPPKLRAALSEMMRIVANQALAETPCVLDIHSRYDVPATLETMKPSEGPVPAADPDADLDEPLGTACRMDDPECESCS